MAKEDVAMQVLQQVVKLPVVKVNRSKFLMDKFSKEVASKDIPRLLEEGPTALLSQETLDQWPMPVLKIMFYWQVGHLF